MPKPRDALTPASPFATPTKRLRKNDVARLNVGRIQSRYTIFPLRFPSELERPSTGNVDADGVRDALQRFARYGFLVA